MQERLCKYLKAVKMKKLQLKMEVGINGRLPSNKAAKLKGAEEVILAILDNDRIENLWENLKL